jgi:hypothetical protein
MVLRKIFGGEMEKLTGGWGKIAIRLKRIMFVVLVRPFGDMKVIYKYLCENVNSVCSFRLTL